MANEEKLDGGILTILTPKECQDYLAAGKVVLIDVRTPSEFAFERIQGAMLAPLSSFDAASMPSQDSKGIIFHCGSGIRSKMIVKKYFEAGFLNVAHMEGGLANWKKSGLSYITIDFGSGVEKVTAMKPAA